ncbi:helix-turn-helix domain-containing protein [Lysobacter korlensis]|uniref:Helix-turn-helix domain-containing protein n=1 Tax=Lysobacter korlensis TaxID=553636 RepID=A0ABV6RMH6_9GAMM
MTYQTDGGPENGTGFGSRLKRSRENAGLTIDEVSQRLKTPARIITALEADDWSILGAPIFIRGQLRSYARLLGEPMPEAVEEAVAPQSEAVKLVSHTHTPRYRRLAEQAGRRAIYIVLTVTLVAPVWMATRSHLSGSLAPAQSLDLPLQAVDADGTTPAPSSPSAAERQPLVASMAALPERRETATAALTLRLHGDTWVEVFARDGSLIEKGLLISGQVRSYDAQRVGRVLLGNSSAVEVQNAGKHVDLAPFSQANVARFTLSSDGSLAPVAH